MININGFNVATDIRGKRFGRLLAVLPVYRDKYRRLFWEFKCDCGKNAFITSNDVVRSKRPSRSCGCFQKEWMQTIHRKSSGEASFNALYGQYVKRSKAKGIEFKLNKEEFKILTKGNCHYCGIEPHQYYRSVSESGDYLYNGIDRVDSSKDYTLDNVVSCCGSCNRAKSNMTVNEFVVWIERIHSNMKGKL
jgi:5-methylcytosine-specific restriction endonuclease McrA